MLDAHQAIVCDDYLVTALKTLCVRYGLTRFRPQLRTVLDFRPPCASWDIREDVAGATFMAFGSAAPEIIINTVSTIKGARSKNDAPNSSTATGISAIIGSGMIAFLLIPGACGDCPLLHPHAARAAARRAHGSGNAVLSSQG